MLVVTNEFYFSDWLFLYYLARNMEPYLFRQMLLEQIIPEIQSEKSSLIIVHDQESDEEVENEKLKESEAEEEDLDDHSLNSEDMDMSIVPPSSLVAVNEKRVKFAWCHLIMHFSFLWLLAVNWVELKEENIKDVNWKQHATAFCSQHEKV